MTHKRVKDYSFDRDEFEEEDDYFSDYGSYGSYGSPSAAMYMLDRNAPMQFSLGDSLEQEKGRRYFVNRMGTREPPPDHQVLEPCMRGMEVVLGEDVYSEEQLITAARRCGYDAEAAVAWLLQAEEDCDDGPFQMDDEDDAVPSPDDVALAKQAQAFTQKTADKVRPEGPVVVKAKPQPRALPKAKAKAPTKAKVKVETEALKTPQETLRSSGGGEASMASPSRRKPPPQMSEKARRKALLEIEAHLAQQEKQHLSIVVVGHVDAGKSTIMGHLLVQLGQIDKKTMHRYKTDSEKQGKGSFAFAWVLDENEDERSRGVTIDVGVNFFETPSKRFTLLDAPGHKDFVPNMITGAAQADCAILVVNATTGEFETGFCDDGQTKEHTLLIRSLGVEQLVVAVNKLDTQDWSQHRFDDIRSQLALFLKKSGFKEKNICFVPCSGLAGENLTKRSEPRLAWYSGPTLEQAIDTFEVPERLVEKPFRMCVNDVFKSSALGVAVAGKIEAGIVTVDSKLALVPGTEVCTVKRLTAHDEQGKWALAGDNVELGVTGIDMANFRTGAFLCDPEHPIVCTQRFKAKVLTFQLDFPITSGVSCILQYQCVQEPAVIAKLLEITNRTTGETAKKRPRCICSNTTAVVEIHTQRPVCLDLYAENKQLGRFTLRNKGTTLASGLVIEFVEPARNRRK